MSHLLSDHPEMAVPIGDTPRTDANEQSVMDNGYSNGGYTDSDFSRQLEIGLAAAMKELAALREQLAEALEENARLNKWADDMTDAAIHAEAALDKADK